MIIEAAAYARLVAFKLTNELFMDLFESHLVNPTYLCSDANFVYENYYNLKNISHYEKHSNYLTIIEKNGYKTPDYSDPVKTKETEKKNQKILEKLYNAELIDKITNRGYMSYADLEPLKIKTAYLLVKSMSFIVILRNLSMLI